MAKAVFYHRPDSVYDDQPERYYHFPKQYLSRVEQILDDQIVYYGPDAIQPGRFYTAVARVTGIRSDSTRSDHFYADISEYIDFDRPVLYTENGGFERGLVRTDGSINGGRAVQAVRIIEATEFAAIVEAGLSAANEWPDRKDTEDASGFSDLPQMEIDRPIVQQLLNRRFRDIKFRHHVRRAYDRTCVFTGLRLINGHGRPEVEAAHIVPVEENGPDSVRNGIALSGTVHWMFDRGLLSLSDDFTILQSRQLNHDISHLLHADQKARVPEDHTLRPHPVFLDWHRRNRFKH